MLAIRWHAQFTPSRLQVYALIPTLVVVFVTMINIAGVVRHTLTLFSDWNSLFRTEIPCSPPRDALCELFPGLPLLELLLDRRLFIWFLLVFLIDVWMFVNRCGALHTVRTGWCGSRPCLVCWR